ncbi:bifunctional serine/threonine-protein kinase/ABC transporter substrate-binding protein [Streptomyces sp. PTY087I2]|uniref:bifunctional serine/threonine-protein kinase/ABC transporter substrate-binding protein n=1 Tax=Streptomyces sp. PTY087I2 TaxID=1819298 RepID=UPI00082918A2|nr:bifunctional serine/threonine-protein kinase/ABC transporter substrate-binding protein [Streptomyces sp. PTY087I2]OCC13334.1 Serine/threonine-protein kinase AfsK [Streptomyces sp. PTY087I2]
MDDLRPTDPARIGGHRLLGRLGAGGMGVVYLGRTDAGALAAIKVILPEYAGDEDFRARFRREAEAARRVDSPWAVSVTGADTEAERPWLATEFVPGPTLSDVVARRGPLPVRSVTVLGRLLARALSAVHAAGLVHRDVKPGNVLLTASGPRLIDFGIARAADATALTATGLIVGTPGFLPPEQVSGGSVGAAGGVGATGSAGASGPGGAIGVIGAAGSTGAATAVGSAGSGEASGAARPARADRAAGPAGATKSSGSTTAAEFAGSAEPAGSADPAESTTAAGSGEGAGSAESTGPATAAGSTDPGGSTTAAGSGEATGAAGPTRADGSTGPAGSTDPAGATESAGPTTAAESIGSTGPTTAAGSTTATRPTGSAGDVFSLGCLLAYAATGRPPFGSGAVDAILYRTVHDAPDLGGIDDPALRALLERCLAKDPDTRPTAADLDTLIAEDLPAGGTADWLPEDVVRIIADRAAALLALPAIDATVAVTEEPGPPQPAPGRRRFLLLAAGGALALGAGAFAAVRLTGDGASGGGDDGAPGGRRLIIGVHADLTGPLSAAGRAQERGVRLAVDRFNSLDDRPFRLAVKGLDDQGDPARSARVAEEFARDPEVVAVIGPTSDDTAGAALSAYDEAVMPVLTVSALLMSFPTRANGSFFQASPSYAELSFPVVHRLLLRPDVERLGILIDRSGGQSAYQAGYAVNLLTPKLTTGTTHPRVVPAGTTVFDPVVTDLLSHRSDALFYAGEAAGAAKVARILADGSFPGPCMAQHTAMGPEFLEQAGAAADGWEFVAPFIDATAPAAATFAAAHRKRFGAAPAAWSAEAYDVAGLVARELATLAEAAAKGSTATTKGATDAAKGASASVTPSGDGRPSRSALTAAIAASRYEGISRTYAFDKERQRLVGQDAHLYRVKDGRVRYVGPAPKPKS